MAVKRRVVHIREVDLTVKALMQEYNVITIYLRGTKQHAEAGLAGDYALIRAWIYKPRPHAEKAFERKS